MFLDVVVEADGPVRGAILGTGPCYLASSSIGPTHYLFGVRDSFDSFEVGGGLIAGDFTTGGTPRVLHPKGYNPSNGLYSPEYIVGRTTYVEQPGLGDTLRSLITGKMLSHIGASEPGLGSYLFQFVGDDLFWQAESSDRSIINVLPFGGKTSTLIRPDADRNEVIVAFATDGVDMVWTYGFDRSSPTLPLYASREMWTAKYTTDPAVVESSKRRLRSAEKVSWDAPRVRRLRVRSA